MLTYFRTMAIILLVTALALLSSCSQYGVRGQTPITGIFIVSIQELEMQFQLIPIIYTPLSFVRVHTELKVLQIKKSYVKNSFCGEIISWAE